MGYVLFVFGPFRKLNINQSDKMNDCKFFRFVLNLLPVEQLRRVCGWGVWGRAWLTQALAVLVLQFIKMATVSVKINGGHLGLLDERPKVAPPLSLGRPVLGYCPQFRWSFRQGGIHRL